MRILITGGAGCLGSNLIEHWLPHGHQIAVLDNFATGKREVVPEVAGLQVHEGHIADSTRVDQVFGSFKPDIVVHAAAAYKDPEDWSEDACTNVMGSIAVARAAEQHQAKRLINFQTALCYGRPTTLPITTGERCAPFTSYGISKTAGEQFMLMAKVPSLSLRIANVTGPRLAIGPIPTFYKRLKAGQKCFCSDTARDFLDMQDFLHFMDLAIHEDAPVGVYNVSSGESHSILEIFRAVERYLGISPTEVPVVPPLADDVPVVCLDSSQTEADFGWKCHLNFEQIIQRQLQWYDQHGVTDVHSHLKPPTAA